MKMRLEQSSSNFTESRCRQILSAARSARIIVVGDVILDHFVWGRSTRISPEAPVPVVDVESESFMPGGAANVARNLASLGCQVAIFGAIGDDAAADQLCRLLVAEKIDMSGLIRSSRRHTSTKIRIVVGQQQVTRLDRETDSVLDGAARQALYRKMEKALVHADALIVADYNKGVVTQKLLNVVRRGCKRKVWISLDPKPSHSVNLCGLSLLTPNRREAFQLADMPDDSRQTDPMEDRPLLLAAAKLLETLKPEVLLITLSELGMLLCVRGRIPVHIHTTAKQVFDVSGAGDTVIASFTLAMSAGASPLEAAILSNQSAGLVVGKIGTATVTPAELRRSFREARASLSSQPSLP
jgi:rfaE bifunctional protein kinase chain/domain